MYYYIYQITNLVNNNIYIGVHRTVDLDDGYMGSGKIIKRAIAKYGLDNFKKDILEFFETSELMYAREKELVTDEFLLREDTYNLRRGGFGGFDYLNKIGKNKHFGKENVFSSMSAEFNKRKSQKLKEDPDFKSRWNGNRFTEAARKLGIKNAQGAAAKEKRISTMKANKHSVGVNNSQYGTMWITDGKINKKLPKEEVIPNGWYKGRTTQNRS